MRPLKPIMAVLAIASVGVMPLRTLADDGKPVATTEDTNPVNKLSKILAENADARKDGGKRISDFVLTPDAAGRTFVDPKADKKALDAVAQDWAEKTAKTSPGTVASLYFVIGPGALQPSWAAKDPVLAPVFKSGGSYETRLREALSTDAAHKGPEWTGKNKIKKSAEKKQVVAFLNDAAARAVDVFKDTRTVEGVKESVGNNNTTAVNVPNGAGGTLGKTKATIPQYTMDDLYGDGAVVRDVWGAHDKGSRKISMKIYTKRGPAPDYKVYSEIGIFDITDKNDIFGQRFPLDSGNQSFTLDDRTPGHKKYDLKFGAADKDGNRTITFSRGDGGHPLTTSVTDLLQARADQAAKQGTVKIGTEEFYALPQGGAKSAVLLFPKSVIDGRTGLSGIAAMSLEPSLYAEIGERGPDGRNQNVKLYNPDKFKGPHLGTVGGKPYHVEYNSALGAWEIKEGEGDLPPPPKKDDAKDGDKDGGKEGGKEAGKDGGKETPKTPDKSGSDGLSIADLEKGLFAKAPECKKNPDDVKDLAPSLQGKYGIIACRDEANNWSQVILTPKTPQTPDQQLQYGSVQGFKLLRARFYDHYLILQFDKQVQYLDLLKQDVVDGKDNGFKLSGFIDVGSKNASKFDDSGAFVDALRNYMGISAGSSDAGAFTEVPKRVVAALGGKSYTLTGAFAKGALIVNVQSGGESFIIWPHVDKPGAPADKTPSPYTSLSGPANAMDGSVSSVDADYPQTIDLAESRQAKSVKLQKDIALYETVDLDGKNEPKKYYVMFSYNALDPKDPNKPEGEKEKKVFRQKPFEVFNATNPLPDGVQLQGLTGDEVVKDRVSSGYRFISGSSKDKGVLAVFQEKQVSGDNQKKKADNCVGPVVWWGLDRDQALKVCKADKF